MKISIFYKRNSFEYPKIMKSLKINKMKVKKTDSGEIYDVQSIDFYVGYRIKFSSRNK